jgi:hypothetical protein
MDAPLRATLLTLLERVLSAGDVNRMRFCDRGAVASLLKVCPCAATLSAIACTTPLIHKLTCGGGMLFSLSLPLSLLPRVCVP